MQAPSDLQDRADESTVEGLRLFQEVVGLIAGPAQNTLKKRKATKDHH